MARGAALVVLVAALLVPAARADGDPASDYLLSQPTFVPPDAAVPKAYSSQLTATVREAKARGFTIRVALISTRYDMGSVGVLYRKPKLYARFLGQELSFVYRDRLLVVMPNGLGASRHGKATPRAQAVVDRITPPGPEGAALASAATRAVTKLAADAGVFVPPQPLAAAGRSGSNTTRDRITIAVAAGVVALLAGLYALFRRRRAARR